MNSHTGGLADRQGRFQTQMEAHKGIIYKVVSAFTWHEQDQQDLVQEISLQLWRAFPKYDSMRAFSTWMYQVSLNTAISWSRKHRRTRQFESTADDLANIPANESDRSESQSLYHLIDTLDDLSRALLLLYIEERSHSEIGEILGISPSNVAAKISRLKARLRLEVEENK